MDHGHSTEPTELTFSPIPSVATAPRTGHHAVDLGTRRRHEQKQTTRLHEAEMSTEKVLPRIEYTSSSKGKQ